MQYVRFRVETLALYERRQISSPVHVQNDPRHLPPISPPVDPFDMQPEIDPSNTFSRLLDCVFRIGVAWPMKDIKHAWLGVKGSKTTIGISADFGARRSSVRNLGLQQSEGLLYSSEWWGERVGIGSLGDFLQLFRRAFERNSKSKFVGVLSKMSMKKHQIKGDTNCIPSTDRSRRRRSE